MKFEHRPSGPDSRPLYDNRQLDAIAKRWNAKALTWDRNLQDPACHLNADDAYQRFLSTLEATLDRRGEFCRKHGVIDVGCATGLVLASVLHRFAWGVGIDLSPEMIKQAEAKRIAHARFIVGDCFKLPELCPKAGVVVSRGILLSHYGPKHATELLSGIRGTLVDGGMAILDFLSENGRSSFPHNPANKYYFTSEAVRSFAIEAGLTNPVVVDDESRRIGALIAQREAG